MISAKCFHTAILGMLGALLATISGCVPSQPAGLPIPRPTHTPWPSDIPDPNAYANMILASVYSTPTMTPLPPETWVPPHVKDPVLMVRVPAGPFLMGSTVEQIKMMTASDQTLCDEKPRTSPSVCYDWRLWAEVPQRVVDVAEFYIDRTEVTNARYRQCIEAGACPDIPEYSPGPIDSSSPEIRYRQYLHDADYDQYPVNVMWDGARAYCQWVGKRLPTEAEWEKAARGTDGRAYPWGNTWDPDKANFDYEQMPVGSYPDGSSPYGALDMAGNAKEWVDGQFRLYPGAENLVPGPPLNDWRKYDLLKPGVTEDYRVARGGGDKAILLFYEARLSTRTISFFRAPDQLFGLRCAYSP